MIGFILWIVVGGLAGYLAGRFMGKEFNVLASIGVGIAGSFVGNIILSFLGYGGDGNLLGQLIVGVIGASLLIWAYGAYRRRQS